jgi:hypothetical protein
MRASYSFIEEAAFAISAFRSKVGFFDLGFGDGVFGRGALVDTSKLRLASELASAT